LGGEAVRLAALQAEEITPQVEGVDLATAVAQDLADAHRAGDHPVEELCLLALGEQFVALDEAEASRGNPRHVGRGPHDDGGREAGGGGGGNGSEGLHRSVSVDLVSTKAYRCPGSPTIQVLPLGDST